MKSRPGDPSSPADPSGLRIEASVARSFSGPFPPPEALRQYNEVVPGAAERIIAMVESQQSHRQQLETHVISSNTSAQKLGTVLGFVVAMTAIVGGIYLVAIGKAASGLASIITALVALAGVFVYGRQVQRRELTEKAQSIKKHGTQATSSH